MNGLRVGDYAVEEILYEDGNLVYARGTAAGSPDVLVCLLADRVVKDARGAAERSERDSIVPPPVELEYLPRGAEASCQGVLPLLALGRTTGWTALVYPFVRALPLALHLKSIPTLRRGEALGYALSAATAVAELHRVGLLSTDVHLGNVLVDEGDAVHLPYNRNLGPERHRDVVKAHPQVKRFDVVAPEQVWGNGPGQGTDIFQIGALLVAGLTRRLLVLSPDVAHRDFQAALSGIYPPADYFEAVPKPFDAFVAKAMAPDPPDRHEDIEAALVELRDLLDKVRITDAVSEVVRQGFVRKGADESASTRVPPPAARTDVSAQEEEADDGDGSDGAAESASAGKRSERRSRPAPTPPRRGRPSSPKSVPAEGTFLERLRERLGPGGPRRLFAALCPALLGAERPVPHRRRGPAPVLGRPRPDLTSGRCSRAGRSRTSRRSCP